MLPLLFCLGVLLSLGVAERLARDRAWREIPIRIHVNGTRGKSTVTRLIWSALREAGIPAAAKTTGTAARVLWPDGREEPIRRLAPANVREQLAFLRFARRKGARAVVVECMAIDPTLQAVTERNMIRATIGVITNVRFDHAEVMGRNLASIAHSLANTIPVRGVLVTGDADAAPVLRARADALGTRVAVGVARSADPASQNQAVALAVARELGIDDAVAQRGFARAPLDPGSVRSGVVTLPGGRATWTDATAANDPDSLALLLPPPDGRARIVIYNHRDDRVPRLAGFVDRSDAFQLAERLVITGPPPPFTLRRRLLRLDRQRPAEFVPASSLARWVRSHAPGGALAFCGNTRGLDVARLLEEAASRD